MAKKRKKKAKRPKPIKGPVAAPQSALKPVDEDSDEFAAEKNKRLAAEEVISQILQRLIILESRMDKLHPGGPH